jgi:hypothetical protein
MDQQELRFLLKCNDKLPIYDNSLLLPIWENIMYEYEELTNNHAYTHSLRKISNDNKKVNRITALIACFWLLKYNDPKAKEDLKYWGLENITLIGLSTKILQEKTKLNIDKIRNNKNKQVENFDFERVIVNMENNLERNLDIDILTVKKWVRLCQSIDERAKQIEMLNQRRTK